MLFTFENCSLNLNLRELLRDSEPISVEPQVFDLLAYLVQNRERVVSKDDLIESIWGGRIVSESTLASRINAVRKAVGDSGKDQRLIRTVSRKGVRFIGEVQEQLARALNVPVNGEAHRRISSPALQPQLIADRPSIAILRFENLSQDPGLTLITNGLVEDVIALLARVPGFFVVARVSSFAYPAGATAFREIGAELGVRYIVTGSARGSAGRVRIAVQLIEVETSNQLWAGRYDVERDDTLELQDEIARQIMSELEPALTRADLSVVRRQHISDVDAWAHFRQAVGIIATHGWNEESVAEALSALRKATAKDPDFALARSQIALLSAFGALLSLVPDRASAERDAKEEAERAVALDPNSSDVLGCAGCALVDIGEHARGRALLQRAVELDPSNAQAHVALGTAMAQAGQYDEGIRRMRLGMRSSPKDFRLTFWNMLLAHALARGGHLQEALSVALTTSAQDGKLYGTRVLSAWMLQRLGRPAEARDALADAFQIRPTLTLDEVTRFFGREAGDALAEIWHADAASVTLSRRAASQPAELRQEIHFCTASDGTRLAYAEVGAGPPLVKVANWLNHLEYDWETPIWGHLWHALAAEHRLIRYDQRGNGLSDWQTDDISFEAFVRDLETVVDAVGIPRFPLFGISQGCAISIAYAIRHPERVSHLVLYGGFARGMARIGNGKGAAQADAIATLMRLGWGRKNPAFRQMFTSQFVPGGTLEQMQWFNDLQKMTASPENAVRVFEAIVQIDVADLLPQVRVPTLVLHCCNDARVPFEDGRRMAAGIPGARFVALEGNNHVILEQDPSRERFLAEVRQFLAS